MPHVDLETGISMHYRDGGRGKPILFVPGYSATVDTWNYAVLDLHGRYRCVCVDLRGHGDSEKPYSDYTYDEMCRDIQAFLQALDLRDVTFVGWSMGAGVGLNYVADFNTGGRVTKFVMVGPATPRFTQTKTEPYGMDEATATATLDAVRRGFPETMAAFAGQNFHHTDMEATQSWFLSTWLQTPAYVGYKYLKTLMTADLRDRLEKVNIPTTIFHGRHDQVCHPGWSEYMLPRIKDARMVWFENSGHALMVEEPDKFSQEVAAFVG
ncbi:MAG: alpha/beta hydrolase [Ardenticatenaceae bacterium]|nr:alpha/beta hydrolase [Ardenticatenaceae bacterium]